MAEIDLRALRLGQEPSDRVFPPIEQQGSTVLQNERRFAERFNRILARAGVAQHHHPFHDLRHTFATDLHLAGVPIFRVSRWLGRSSIQITCDTYSHLLPTPDEHEVIEALGAEGHEKGHSGASRHPLARRPRRQPRGFAR